jgi:hypothetical protein
MEEFILLKKFNTPEEASTVIELLEKNDIEFQIEKDDAIQETVFIGNTFESEMHIKVKPEDMESAQQLLQELVEINAESLDKDYYLLNFTDTELTEILQKPDEWSYNDYLWAQEILKQRGKGVDLAILEDWKKQRLVLLSQPEKISGNYIFSAYLFCLLGGIVGLLMGLHLQNANKTLPNHQKVLTYDENSRKQGNAIKWTGVFFLLIWVALIIGLIINLVN